MNRDDLRAKVRVLMAAGILPNEPPVIHRVAEVSASPRQPNACVICGEPEPTVSYFWPGGITVKLHGACDAAWKQEHETAR